MMLHLAGREGGMLPSEAFLEELSEYELLKLDSSAVEGMHRDVSYSLQVASTCKQAYWSAELRFDQKHGGL